MNIDITVASPADLPAVRAIFRDTVAFGHPLPGGLPRAYESLCVDFYVEHDAGHVGVARHDREVLGYTFICVDDAAHRAWMRRRVPSYLLRTSLATFGRDADGPGPFLRRRLLDGLLAAGSRDEPPAPAHVHLNLRTDARAALVGRQLVAYADAHVAASGCPAWYTEVNTLVGRRAVAFERYGAEVVHRTPNRTFSTLTGQPVERLTIVRDLQTARPVLHAGT